MFILAKLVFKSYMPKQLEKGMWFVSKQKDVVYGKIYEYLQIHELQHVPQDMDSYIAVNGAPVEPYIVLPMNNPDDPEHIIAKPEQIGWWDDEPENEDGSWEDLTAKIINNHIYGENGEEGEIAVEMVEDEDGDKHLVLFDGKVTMRHVNYVDEHEWDDDDDDEEDWDDMDDESDNYDYDTE
jgi:hypothetical protein